VPDTFQSLAVLLLALLPGALYIWGFEREAGQWGISASDRVLRFIGASAVFHAVAFPVTFQLWRVQIRSGRLAAGRANWVVLWVACLCYVAVPVAVGSVVGVGARQSRRWTRFVVGRHPAPKAWDHLFAREEPGWMRMKMRSGPWIGGLFADVGPIGPYAAGYPDAQDIYLASTAEIDRITGEFVLDDGAPVTTNSGLLVGWDQIEYLEFTPLFEEPDPEV
jgi:hypothetical protein